MTEAQENAKKEINFLRAADTKIKAVPTKAQLLKLIRNINQHAKSFKDQYNNHIYEFFMVNGIENHNFQSKKLNRHDVHLAIVDEIKAVKGNIKLLLIVQNIM